MTGAAIFITGISAAGKTTVAQELAGRFPKGVHVKGDVFRRMVVSGRVEMHGGVAPEAVAQLRLRYRLGGMVTDEYAKDGFTVVWQDIVLGPMLAEIPGLSATRPLAVVVLAPSLAAIEGREAGRPKRAYGPGQITAAELDRSLRTETPRLGLWLDTTDQSPAETATEILDRVWTEAVVAG